MSEKNFLFVRLSSAGDVVLTFPAYFHLRRAMPESRVFWAVDERFEGLLDLLPGVEKIVFPGKTLKKSGPPAKEKMAAAASFVRLLRNASCDAAIDFQGLFKSGLISYLSGARLRLAFAPGGHDSREMNHLFQTRLVAPDALHPLSGRILYRSICLAAAACGASPSMPEVRLSIPEADRAKIDSFFDEQRRKAPFGRVILLNPFTNWPTKTWPAEKWRELIGILKRSPEFSDALFVVFWGPAERSAAEGIVSGLGGAVLAPDTTLRESFALIGRADAVVSGDSFALHAAFVSKKPVVAIFGASDPSRCAPFGSAARTVASSLPCQHCFKKACPLGTGECIKGVAPDSVANALFSLEI